MWAQCRVCVVRRVHFAVVQVQYVADVETRRSRLTARHFYAVQKSETRRKKTLVRLKKGFTTISNILDRFTSTYMYGYRIIFSTIHSFKFLQTDAFDVSQPRVSVGGARYKIICPTNPSPYYSRPTNILLSKTHLLAESRKFTLKSIIFLKNILKLDVDYSHMVCTRPAKSSPRVYRMFFYRKESVSQTTYITVIKFCY